jgi:iron(III) transport system permease protein
MSGLSIPLAGKQQRQTHQHRPARMLVILAMLVSLLALLPVGFVIATGIDTGWESVKALVFRPRVAELLANTLLLILFSLPICVCLGVALAWLTERTALRGRRVWSLLVVAPLAIPAFVQSYAWVSVIPLYMGWRPPCLSPCWLITRLFICRLPRFCGDWIRTLKTLPHP